MSPEQIKASLEFLKRQMKNASTPRVLVVEDDRDDEYLLVRQLAHFNVEVVVARTGEEAQRLMSENGGINIVFLDLKLPLVPGVEVIKQRRCLDPKTHFVAVTGTRDLNAVDEALKAGAVLVLQKPVTYETLAKIFDTKVP